MWGIRVIHVCRVVGKCAFLIGFTECGIMGKLKCYFIISLEISSKKWFGKGSDSIFFLKSFCSLSRFHVIVYFSKNQRVNKFHPSSCFTDFDDNEEVSTDQIFYLPVGVSLQYILLLDYVNRSDVMRRIYKWVRCWCSVSRETQSWEWVLYRTNPVIEFVTVFNFQFLWKHTAPSSHLFPMFNLPVRMLFTFIWPSARYSFFIQTRKNRTQWK